jgi:hypothetical protein
MGELKARCRPEPDDGADHLKAPHKEQHPAHSGMSIRIAIPRRAAPARQDIPNSAAAATALLIPGFNTKAQAPPSRRTRASGMRLAAARQYEQERQVSTAMRKTIRKGASVEESKANWQMI